METLFGISMNVVMVYTLVATIAVVVVVAFLAWRKPILARLALRNIPRRRAETVLIVFGLMLATLLITAAFGTGDTMAYSMKQAFAGSLGGIDLVVQKVNPVVAVSGPPDFNRPVATFDEKTLEELKAKVGNDDRIDGWAPVMEQVGPVIDTTSEQASGQTFIRSLSAESRQTLGELHTLSGAVFDVASLKDGEVLLDKGAADKLDGEVGHTIRIVVAGKPTDLRVREIVQSSSPSNQFPVAFVTLPQVQAIYDRPGEITGVEISLRGGDLDGVQYSREVADELRGLVDNTFQVQESKKEALDTANLLGNLFTTIFVGVALFSIAAGILLIFLIFSMLAAERKSEMGMARAVGTQRSHLTQMFVFEGLAYDLVSAAVGAALGVLVGFVMVNAISSIFGNFGFTLIPHVEVRSLVVAYCIGMLVTFLTVAISAGRVSRLNIVAAIRDIPDMPRPDKSLAQMLITPFEDLAEGRPMSCIGGIFSLFASLLMSGPVTGGLGIAMLASGWLLENGFLFHTGASLSIIALALTIRWILRRMRLRPATRDRIAFTFAGLALLVYWSLPIDALHTWFGVPEFGFGIEIFFVSGILMVAGAVWAIIYNEDVLLGIVSFVLGRVGRMRPVLKTAVAYPMSSIFRTGMTVAMFALIIFMLIVMSVLNQVGRPVDPAGAGITGGYDIEAPVSYANPIQDIDAQVEANPELKGKFSAIAGQTLLPLELRQPGAKKPLVPPTEEQIKAQPSLKEGWYYYNARFVDQEFLETNRFELAVRAKGYETDRDVWDAVAKDPTLVVIDSLPVLIGQQGAGGGGGFGGPLFYVSGVDMSKPTMDPVEIELRLPGVPGAQTARVKIVGVMTQAAAYYTGLYVSRDAVAQIAPMPVPASTYFFRVNEGESPEQLRRALGSAFLNNGMEPVVIEEEIRRNQALNDSLFGLLQGFMTLGLFVGIAALGVISTRAVVERRQQIGVLRAIGYQRGMVATSFLLESSFIALLGILVGVGLGLILSYKLVGFIAEDSPTITFDVPWVQIAAIVVLSYLASLITTVLPARNAARIYPAEALRYE